MKCIQASSVIQGFWISRTVLMIISNISASSLKAFLVSYMSAVLLAQYTPFFFACKVEEHIKTSEWNCAGEKPLKTLQIFTPRLERFSLKNRSKQFTQKHEPFETQFISLPHLKPPLACTGDESYKLSVTSALAWNRTKIPVAVYLVSCAAESSRQTLDLTVNGTVCFFFNFQSNGATL